VYKWNVFRLRTAPDVFLLLIYFLESDVEENGHFDCVALLFGLSFSEKMMSEKSSVEDVCRFFEQKGLGSACDVLRGID